MSFLGHLISSGVILVNPLKVNIVLYWETSKSITKIRSFMGLVDYTQGL